MGYDLHIVRTESWLDAADDPISLDEWLAAAAASPHVEEDTRVSGNGARPFHLVADPDGPNLYWSEDGRIVVRGVEETSFPHVVDLAHELGAGVIGDDGEHHRRDGTWYEPEDDGSDPGVDVAPSPPVRRSAWRTRLRRTRPMSAPGR